VILTELITTNSTVLLRILHGYRVFLASIQAVNSRHLKLTHVHSRFIANILCKTPRRCDCWCGADVSRDGDLGAAVGLVDAGGGNGGAGGGFGANH
jgi:hypothetical protein